MQLAKRLYTPAEYLALEEEAQSKSEYFEGEIFATPGASRNHVRISLNLSIALDIALKNKPFEVFNSDMKVWIAQAGIYTYPDLSIAAEPVEFYAGRDDIIINPCLIVEVLSPSTSGYDRQGKFEHYRSLASLQDYVMISQDKIGVEYYHRVKAEEWTLKIYPKPTDKIRLNSIKVTLPLERVYRKINFSEAESSGGRQD